MSPLFNSDDRMATALILPASLQVYFDFSPFAAKLLQLEGFCLNCNSLKVKIRQE